MKPVKTHLTSEVKLTLYERKKKIIVIMYIICALVFTLHNFSDIYYENYNLIPIRVITLMFLVMSFFMFYKNKQYEKASYSILLILAIATIIISVTHAFDNFTIAFIIPFTLGSFSLFGWKKGIFFSLVLLFVLIFLVFLYEDHFITSNFLNNKLSVFNFIFILGIVYAFGYYYENTRVDAYNKLIEYNNKKDLLYKEVHHRVKNNLNLVSSMLSMQAEHEDKTVQGIIEKSKNRINSIAMVHSMLYVSNDIEKVNTKLFIEKLSSSIFSSIDKNINIILKIKELGLSLNEIVPIGLIVNELFTNSLKYAFKETNKPTIIVILKIHKENIFLTYHDNGTSYEKNYTQGFGLKLVDLNVKQLKGTLKINHKNGLSYKITYKRVSHV